MYKKIYRSLCLLSVITIFLTLAMTLAACYTSFSNKFKEEIKNEAIVIAKVIENESNPADVLKNIDVDMNGKQVVLFLEDGRVLYNNAADESVFDSDFSSPEIKTAMSTGYGEATRDVKKSSQKLYCYAVRLSDGSVLRLSSPIKNIIPMFYSVLVSVLFIAALMYILTAVVATQLTDNIIKPIRKITSIDEDAFENVYEEIQPLLKRIARQNREISQQTSKAISQKAHIQAIMDNMNEGLIITDKNSEILSINSCALDIFSVDEYNVNHKYFDRLTEDKQLRAALQKALAGNKDNLIFANDIKTYQIFYGPIYEKNEINGAVMLLFDVSQKTETEKIRREFTANVSHELKTPLTTIHGYAQIISNGIAKPDDISGFIKKIEKESSRLITLVNDIIELSHLDETSENPEKQSVSLRNVVNEVLENLGENAKKKDISIEVSGNDTTVFANLSQVTEMIYNLTDNAIKYNKDGGNVNITIGDKKLTISDTGIGIPEKYFDRIFERFFRVDKSHSKMVNGTGLGLSIVKHLAKANNTEITVSSELGKGTEFTLCFNGKD